MNKIIVPGKTTLIGVQLVPVKVQTSSAPATPSALTWVDVSGPDFWLNQDNAEWDGTALILPSGSSYTFLTPANDWLENALYLLSITSDWGTAEMALAYDISGTVFTGTDEQHYLVLDGSGGSNIRLYHGDWSQSGNNVVRSIKVAKLPVFTT